MTAPEIARIEARLDRLERVVWLTVGLGIGSGLIQIGDLLI